MSNRHQRRKAACLDRRVQPDEWRHPERMPEYLIRAHAERVRSFGNGPGVFLNMVAHDHWCPRPDGGPCTCYPDVSAKRWGQSNA
jgi:hypothetical protein